MMTLLVKFIVVIFLIAILYSLGTALVFLVRNKEHSEDVVKALTWRISLSLGLFILLFVAYALGWIQPHGI